MGITQSCSLFNVMQRQGQEKDKQVVRREQRRGVENPPPPRSFILFLSSPLHPSALLLFFLNYSSGIGSAIQSLCQCLYSVREKDKHIFRKSTKGAYMC